MPGFIHFRIFLISFLLAPVFIDFPQINFVFKLIFLGILGIFFLLNPKIAISRKSRLLAIVTCVSALLLSSFYYSEKINKNIKNEKLTIFVNKKIIVTGSVSNKERRENNFEIQLLTAKICLEENIGCQKINEKILIFLPLQEKIYFEDELEISGILILPQNNESYEKFLKRNNIFYLLNKTKIIKLTSSASFSLKRNLEILKEKLSALVLKNMKWPENSILIGLIFGGANYLNKESKTNFQNLGLSHILAISGYNITIIVNSLKGILCFLRKKHRLFLIILLIAMFTIFVGANPPVVRAAIMAVLNIIALNFGYKGNILNAILLSAFFMYIFDPLIITFDLSFQLSFLATIGVLFLTPYFQKKLQKIPAFFRENLSVTLSAQLATMAVILLNFKKQSLIAPLANILILPLIPAAMLFGTIGLVFSLILNNGARIFFLPAEIILSLIIKITDFLNKIPFPKIDVTSFL